jgi:hypothetical protein
MSFKKTFLVLIVLAAIVSVTAVCAVNADITSSAVEVTEGKILPAGTRMNLGADGSISAADPNAGKDGFSAKGTITIDVSALKDTEKEQLQKVANGEANATDASFTVKDNKSSTLAFTDIDVDSLSLDGDTLTVEVSGNEISSQTLDNPEVTSFTAKLGTLDLTAKTK